MNKMILLAAILCVGCTAANADYYVQHNNGVNSGISQMPTSQYSSTYNAYSNIGGTYYSSNPHNPVSYEIQGNKIYGSDGSSYTKFGNTIQSNSPPCNTYQIQNNIIKPLY